MNKTKRILISGGGTGGHIYPALSIANELKSRYENASFLFVGAKDKMEMEKVPQAGFPIKGLWIAGLQRKFTFQNLLFPVKLVLSLVKSYMIIKKFKPQVVVGTGGFASGPVMFVASRLGIPCIIQEQNSYPGITNKLLASKAYKICVAYQGLEKFFPKDKIVVTGNPVRQDLLNVTTKKNAAIDFFHLDPSKKTLLVLGGSLGARAINELILDNLSLFKEKDVQVIWQTGKFYIDKYKECASTYVQTHAFISQMDMAYAVADIIISRAGASSVSELCMVGKPVIFIPSPNVAEDHQTKNAKAITQNNAAILLSEKELETFEKLFSNLISDDNRLNTLSKNISKLAKPNATKEIVNFIEEAAKWI